jgi:hypothetical protein
MTLISNSIRQAVVERAMNRCEYCRLAQESQVATFPVDHIIPVSLRGLTELENLALTCPRCNALKWIHIEAEEAETGEIVRLFNPRIDLWSDHFRWNEAEPARIDALTAIARATAVLLQLNADYRITIRRWLAEVGKHPPAE